MMENDRAGLAGRAGIRKRVSLDDPSTDHFGDALGTGSVISTLMMRRPLQRRDSKPNISQTAHKVGILGSDHAVYLVGFLVVGLFIFVVVESSLHGVGLFGSGGDSDSNGTNGSNNGAGGTNGAGGGICNGINNMDGIVKNSTEAWFVDFQRTNNKDYLTKFWFDKSRMSSLTGFRDFSEQTASMMDDKCGWYEYDLTKFPKTTIVVGPTVRGLPIDNELLSATVHSILARTPPELIAEIVIVEQELSDKPIQDDKLDAEYQQLQDLSPLVKLVKIPGIGGVVRARIGVIDKTATGSLIVLMDPFVEVWSSTWLQQLVLPVMENPRTIAVPTLRKLRPDRSLDGTDKTDLYYTTLHEEAYVQKLPTRFRAKAKTGQAPSGWEPFETAYIEGPVLAFRKDQFQLLGKWDRGLERYGGDNLALAFKYWMCHGRVVAVPCAHAGYVSLSEWTLPPVPESIIQGDGIDSKRDFKFFDKSLKDDPAAILRVKNLMRVIKVWVGDDTAAKQHFYRAAFGNTNLPPEWNQYETDMNDDESFIDAEIRVKEKFECHDFEWFDRHVLLSKTGKHHPWFVDITNRPH